MDDLTGRRLNDYQVLRLLGRGAMAAVYLAEQQSLARRVALKVLAAELCRDRAYVERFQHEARAAASLVHPGIVQVYEVGVVEVDGCRRHYLAQEYVPGGTLARLAQKSGVLPPGRVLAVLQEVGSALSAAADRGLVHRDIKPDNLMLDRSGAVKVADFGLARLLEANTPRMTQAGVAMGTPLYMSPEQIEGREVDSRSDLYSLGVTAYQLLTGDPPFTGDTPLSVAVQHLNTKPKPVAERQPSVPAALAAVVDRLLAKGADGRYESPAAMLDVLGEVAHVAERDSWGGPAGSVPGRSGVWVALGGLDGDAIDRLSAAMHAESRRGRSPRRSLLVTAAGLLLGVVAGGALSPKSPASASRVERFDDVRRQLFHAKMADTPDAWRAVIAYFPDADAFYHGLALRGAAVASLRRGEDRQAVRALERIASDEIGADGVTDPAIAAARVVAYARTGQPDRARSAGAAYRTVPSEVRAAFAQALPELAAEADAALARLN